MTSEVRLSDMTEREKDTTLLVLSGYSRKLKGLLEELAERNGYVRHRLDDLLKEYEPHLGLLERTYSRAILVPNEISREATRNDRIWAEVSR